MEAIDEYMVVSFSFSRGPDESEGVNFLLIVSRDGTLWDVDV